MSYASTEEFEYLIDQEYPTYTTFGIGGNVELYSPDEALYVCQESIESVRTAFYFREELEIDVEPFVEEINQAYYPISYSEVVCDETYWSSDNDYCLAKELALYIH